eukprot:CAMPEP_0114523234 /NCGR_PEP_ID=MMETSP0109-20121206/21183_1 /TAXON_ID=29199 /ORGANISM="Chlorarachnion reptans, Strain CCCM449" /LENGTH=266 /DNA_ID=CAMNT_0001704537 /DNA_START=82 /DNA_END=882 /DNA_ORIENTATION=+
MASRTQLGPEHPRPPQCLCLRLPNLALLAIVSAVAFIQLEQKSRGAGLAAGFARPVSQRSASTLTLRKSTVRNKQRVNLRVGSEPSSGSQGFVPGTQKTPKKSSQNNRVPIPEGWEYVEAMKGVGPFVLGQREKDVMKHVKGDQEVVVEDQTMKSIRCSDGIELMFCGRRRLDTITIKPPYTNVKTPEGVEFGMTVEEVKTLVGRLIPFSSNMTDSNGIQAYFSFKTDGILFAFKGEDPKLSSIVISTDYDTLSDMRKKALEGSKS